MHRHLAGAAIQDQGYDHSEIKIGPDAWLAAHVVVMPGCDIGSHAVVGSNAVVTRPVNDNDIVAGVPAKPIKGR
jgi:acetyltransferase-like isoleucine patch superfamily enzyme